MSNHTDKTSSMVDEFRREIYSYRKGYTIKFKTTGPFNKNIIELEDIKYKFGLIKNQAANYGIMAEFNIVSTPTPEDQHGYNCIGCRKRRKGDYMWLGYDLVPIKKEEYSYGAWFHHVGKVCSNECSELMILRLM